MPEQTHAPIDPAERPLPPGTTEWGTDLEKQQADYKKAQEAAKKTPSVVLDALEEPAPASIAGLEFHPFTLQTYLNLARIGSPFVERQEGREIGVEDIVTALWVMASPDDEVRRTVKFGGEMLDNAIGTFAASIPMAGIGSLAGAITSHIAKSFGPVAQMNPPQQEGGESPLDATSSATEPAGS